jgi:hypothetical protein
MRVTAGLCACMRRVFRTGAVAVMTPFCTTAKPQLCHMYVQRTRDILSVYPCFVSVFVSHRLPVVCHTTGMVQCLT